MIKKKVFIRPHAKGFFIVEFGIAEDKDLILDAAHGFGETHGLCMKPWSLSFNHLTDFLAPVSVRLPNLPLHFWGLSSWTMRKFLCDVGLVMQQVTLQHNALKGSRT